MTSGVYLLKVSDEFTKVGRSDQLERRLGWWQSHGLQLIRTHECEPLLSRWLEFALLRCTLAPTTKQVKAFQRAHPMFPNNRHSMPSGWTEWRCVGAEQSAAILDTVIPMIDHLGQHVPRGEFAVSHGITWLRANLPTADSNQGTPPAYRGPVPDFIRL